MRGNTVVGVGGRPCGLACASRLVELGHDQVLLLESAVSPRGLAASIVDGAGFTWDHRGHVVFSHYGEFDGLLGGLISAQHRPGLTGDEGSDLDFDSWMLATIAPYVRP